MSNRLFLRPPLSCIHVVFHGTIVFPTLGDWFHAFFTSTELRDPSFLRTTEPPTRVSKVLTYFRGKESGRPQTLQSYSPKRRGRPTWGCPRVSPFLSGRPSESCPLTRPVVTSPALGSPKERSRRPFVYPFVSVWTPYDVPSLFSLFLFLVQPPEVPSCVALSPTPLCPLLLLWRIRKSGYPNESTRTLDVPTCP